MTRPFLIILGIAVGIVALLFVAAIVAVNTVDVATLTAPITARVKAQTGRDLSIKGGISIRPSLEPKIEVRDIALANPPWASGPNLITAKRMEIELALMPLMQRRFEIRRIVLTEPTIALETDASGHGNWENAAAGGTEPASRKSPKGPAAPATTDPLPLPAGAEGAAASLPAALAVGMLQIENGILTYRNGRSGAVTHVDIQHLELQARDLSSPVNAAFRGKVDGVPVALTGNAGPLDTLLERREPYPLTAQGEVGGQSTIVKARLVRNDTATQVRDIDFTLGSSRVTGTVTINRGVAGGAIAVALASPRLALSDLRQLPAVVAGGAAGASVAAASGAAASAAKPGAHLIPDAALPLAWLRETDLRLELAVDVLVLPDGEARNVRLAATASQGRLQVTRLAAALFGGSLDASATVDATAASPAVELRLDGRDLDAGALLKTLGMSREVRGAKAVLHLQARSHGRSLHEWASTANGEASVVVGAGTVPFTPTDRDSLYAQVSSALSPLARKGDAVVLRCAVLRMPLREGIGSLDRTLAVETDNLGVDGSGRIDLARETLELNLHPTLREGGGLLVADIPGGVRVHGPWRAPRIEVDHAATANAVVRLGAIAATGGVAALGGALLLSGLTAGGPCAAALGQASRNAAPARVEGQIALPDIAKSLGRLLR